MSVLEYANQKHVSGFLMSTDIFKAYDRTNISFIREVMSRMGYVAGTVDLVEYCIQVALLLYRWQME